MLDENNYISYNWTAFVERGQIIHYIYIYTNIIV